MLCLLFPCQLPQERRGERERERREKKTQGTVVVVNPSLSYRRTARCTWPRSPTRTPRVAAPSAPARFRRRPWKFSSFQFSEPGVSTATVKTRGVSYARHNRSTAWRNVAAHVCIYVCKYVSMYVYIFYSCISFFFNVYFFLLGIRPTFFTWALPSSF